MSSSGRRNRSKSVHEASAGADRLRCPLRKPQASQAESLASRKPARIRSKKEIRGSLSAPTPGPQASEKTDLILCPQIGSGDEKSSPPGAQPVHDVRKTLLLQSTEPRQAPLCRMSLPQFGSATVRRGQMSPVADVQKEVLRSHSVVLGSCQKETANLM